MIQQTNILKKQKQSKTFNMFSGSFSITTSKLVNINLY